jgi:hypothetical protein
MCTVLIGIIVCGSMTTMSCKVLINTGYHFLYDKPFLVFIINFPESIPYTLLLLYSLLSHVTLNRQTSGESASLPQSAEVATSDVTPRSGWVKLAKTLWPGIVIIYQNEITEKTMMLWCKYFGYWSVSINVAKF